MQIDTMRHKKQREANTQSSACAKTAVEPFYE
jgi:hypothetical protein